jgi:hypothetical protein
MAFTWSKSKRAYINKATGKAVSVDQLAKWASQSSDASKARVQKLAEQLNNGEITERQFQLAMREEIGKGHSAFWAVAFGGLLAMSAHRWLQARRIIGHQQLYFMRFARDILTGGLSPDQIVNRAGMYGEAMYSTQQNGTVARERELAAETGSGRFVRRVLDPAAEHCTDCPELAGVYPIESVPPIGASECMSRCRCTIEPIEPAATEKPREAEARKPAAARPTVVTPARGILSEIARIPGITPEGRRAAHTAAQEAFRAARARGESLADAANEARIAAGLEPL